jgi:hypothetical protein
VTQKVEGERHPADGTAWQLQDVDMIKGLHDDNENQNTYREIARFVNLLLFFLSYLSI